MAKFDPLARWICSQSEAEKNARPPEQEQPAVESATHANPGPTLVQKTSSGSTFPSKQKSDVVGFETVPLKPSRTKKAS